MFQRLRSKLTYANVISSLCLFILLGGGAYAASRQLAKNSVGTKQLKNGAVTLSKLSKSVQTSLKGATGPTESAVVPVLAEKPPTEFWAVVDANGDLKRGSGVTSASTISGEIGKFEVDFDQDVSNCSYQATIDGTSSLGPSVIEAFPRPSKSNAVQVNTWNSNGFDAARAFSVAVFC